MRYDGGRQSLDRHATYIVATFVTVASISRLDWEFGRGDRSALELRIGQLVALAKGSVDSVAAPRRATSSRRSVVPRGSPIAPQVRGKQPRA